MYVCACPLMFTCYFVTLRRMTLVVDVGLVLPCFKKDTGMINFYDCVYAYSVHICMYVHMCVRTLHTYVRTLRTLCTYVCMYVRTVCTYVCMYVQCAHVYM